LGKNRSLVFLPWWAGMQGWGEAFKTDSSLLAPPPHSLHPPPYTAKGPYFRWGNKSSEKWWELFKIISRMWRKQEADPGPSIRQSCPWFFPFQQHLKEMETHSVANSAKVFFFL
jgi:hypothetical protein